MDSSSGCEDRVANNTLWLIIDILLYMATYYIILYTAVRSIFANAQFLPHITVAEGRRAPKLGGMT